MATGTKACGWPLMANCILHSSFVNCCLPSSHFLLGHGTKPRTGGIRNGTSAPPMYRQALSTSFSPSLSFSLLLSLSLSFFLYLSLCPHRAAPPFIFSSPCALPWPRRFSLSFLDMRSSLLQVMSFWRCARFFFASVTASIIHTDANKTAVLYMSTLMQKGVFLSQFCWRLPENWALWTRWCMIYNFSQSWTMSSVSTLQWS